MSSASWSVPVALSVVAMAMASGCKSKELAELPEIQAPELRADPQARPPGAYSLAEGCALEYRFDSDAEIHMDRGAFETPTPTQGIRLRGGFHMSGGGERLLIDNDVVEMQHVRGGVRRPATAQPARTLAQIRLSSEQGALVEQEGPTSLWSAYGSFSGLLLLFPALPGAATATTWHLQLHDRSAGIPVEVERGSMKFKGDLPKSQSLQVTAQVQELERLRVNGEPAVRLSAEWRYKQKGGTDRMAMTASTSGRGVYVVLSSGRLLSADLEQTSEVEMGSQRMQMRQTHEMRARARLVRACDGVVTPPPPDQPPSEAERALAVLRRFTAHLQQGRFGQAAGMFAPEVSLHHGPDALSKTLQWLMVRHGPHVLGTPMLAHDVEAPRPGAPFTITLMGNVKQKDGKSLTVQCHYVVQNNAVGGQIKSLGITSVQGSDKMDIFEASIKRLNVGQAR